MLKVSRKIFWFPKVRIKISFLSTFLALRPRPTTFNGSITISRKSGFFSTTYVAFAAEEAVDGRRTQEFFPVVDA